MYAIIEDSGTQIKVSEGDTIQVDPRDLPEDAVSITFDRVLMVGGGEGEARIGQPLLEGVSVAGDVISEEAGEKIRVVKFKRRKTYLRRKGHRQPYLKVRITGINA